jgi:hypothetical protein
MPQGTINVFFDSSAHMDLKSCIFRGGGGHNNFCYTKGTNGAMVLPLLNNRIVKIQPNSQFISHYNKIRIIAACYSPCLNGFQNGTYHICDLKIV